jgi:hypothetical protein
MAGILEGKAALVTGVSADGQVGQAVAKALGKQVLLLSSSPAARRMPRPGLRSCEQTVHASSPWPRTLAMKAKCGRWWSGR